MTEFGIPLPPDDLAQVWDKHGDPWMRQKIDPTNQAHRGPGGWWAHANGRSLHWSDLINGYAPLCTELRRCEARIELESPTSDVEWEMLRCSQMPGHGGLHSPDLDALKWDERKCRSTP